MKERHSNKHGQYDQLAYEVANHPQFLNLGKRSLKKLAKKIAKNRKKK